MKQRIFILFTLICTSLAAYAQQEYRLTKSTGQLKLNIAGVIIEGYDGKEIIFSGQKTEVEEPTDERAKGLVPISSSQFSDNTGLGINVSESGQDITVNLVSKKPIGLITVKVPESIKVSIINNSNRLFTNYSYNNLNSAEPITIRNLKSEIEISVSNNSIKLENNTGPMNIKTVSGAVDAIFSSDIKGPVSIISVMNHVDVTMPSAVKANIEMGTSLGKLYAGKEFKIDYEKLAPEHNIINVRYNEARSTSNKASTKVDEVTVLGYPARAVAGTKVSVDKKNLERSKVAGVKVETSSTINRTTGLTGKVSGIQMNRTDTLTTKVKGVEISGSGIQVLRGENLTPTVFTTGSFFSGGDRIKGKLNGGGVDLIFKSTNKNVYLRQQ